MIIPPCEVEEDCAINMYTSYSGVNDSNYNVIAFLTFIIYKYFFSGI